ncbi:MAG TPA: IclR family transcriptional regulator [Thermoleophilia bacterium]|nr:IclR family transcriptional regulator [Thermoleophilia bacterium]
MARKIGARNRTSGDEGTKTNSSNGDRLFVQALVKGLQVLGLFDSLRPEWTVDEMAQELDLPRMTVYRVVKTLEREGYLVGDPATNRYHLGPMILAAANASSEQWRDLLRVARPHLEELAKQTGETVSLAIEVDGVAIEIDAIITARPFRRQLAPGRVVGYTATAHGKVFAAHMSSGELDKVLRAPFQPRVSRAIDADSLQAELRKVLEEGVAYDFEERDVGTCAVAAPIRDQLGDVVASLGILAPPGRFGPAEREVLADAVKKTSRTLSAFIGYDVADTGR